LLAHRRTLLADRFALPFPSRFRPSSIAGNDDLGNCPEEEKEEKKQRKMDRQRKREREKGVNRRGKSVSRAFSLRDAIIRGHEKLYRRTLHADCMTLDGMRHKSSRLAAYGTSDFIYRANKSLEFNGVRQLDTEMAG